MADNTDYGWDEAAFVSLLDKLIGVAEQCQNKPPTMIPQGMAQPFVVTDFLRVIGWESHRRDP